MSPDVPGRRARLAAAGVLVFAAIPVLALAGRRLSGGFALPDARLVESLATSLGLGAAVAALALPLGLAVALVLRRLGPRLGAILMTMLAATVLMPGAVAGLATLLLWRDLDVAGGFGVTVLARTGITAAFVALVFLARLRGLDPDLETTARDLGASRALVLKRILLPHLAPAATLCAALAVLVTLGEHDTATFTIGGGSTLATEIAVRLRFHATAGAETLGLAVLAAAAAAILAVARRRRGRDGGTTG